MIRSQEMAAIRTEAQLPQALSMSSKYYHQHTGINCSNNVTLSKLREELLYKKSYGRNEIFEEKMHGKEVSHDRAIPLFG